MILVYEDSGIIRTMEPDATTREVHAGTAVVTKHPMETGAARADHIVPEPLRYTCDIVISNTPTAGYDEVEAFMMPLVIEGKRRRFIQAASVQGGQTFPLPTNGFPRPAIKPVGTPAVWADVPDAVSGLSLQFPKSFDRVKTVLTLLEKIRSEGIVCSILTDRRDYPEMGLTSYTDPVTTIHAAVFTLEFEATSFSSLEIVDIPVPLEVRAKKVVPQGPKATYELEPQQESIASAGLKDLAEKAVSSGIL